MEAIKIRGSVTSRRVASQTHNSINSFCIMGAVIYFCSSISRAIKTLRFISQFALINYGVRLLKLELFNFLVTSPYFDLVPF